MNIATLKYKNIIPYQELSGSYNNINYTNSWSGIIPYQELSGSYNGRATLEFDFMIIPYQELSGSYNELNGQYELEMNYTIPRTVRELQRTGCTYTSSIILYHTKNCQGATTEFSQAIGSAPIIPYQELSGSYNTVYPARYTIHDYTIPRTVRELQHPCRCCFCLYYYTIPRTVRELQPRSRTSFRRKYYTIPRTVRELQHSVYEELRKEDYTIPRTVRELQRYSSWKPES